MTMKVSSPVSYEDSFVSYREEWEKLCKQSQLEDVNVLDLQWLTQDEELFLIACTDAGEVLVWNMEKRLEQELEDGGLLAGEKKKLPQNVAPDKRIKLSDHPLHKLAIAEYCVSGSANETATSKKRKRSGDDGEQKTILFIAGEIGLWSVPLNEMASSKEASPENAEKILDHEQILDIQIHQNRLFALSSDQLFVRDISEPDTPWSKLSLSPRLKNQLQTQRSNREVCTSLLVSSFESAATKCWILVGTNQSRILLLQVELGDVTVSLTTKPTTLDWNATASKESARTASQPSGFGEATKLSNKRGNKHKQASTITWTITDIVETHGTWWTICAKANDTTNSRVGGKIVSFHASSKALVASCETPEAIASITTLPANDGDMALCSVANQQTMTVWKSPYRLGKNGSMSTTAPSNKAVTTIAHSLAGTQDSSTLLAAAGVGNSVDIFVDSCRARTLTINQT